MTPVQEIEALSDRVVGLAARVTELEQQLADADTLADRLRVTAHEVLDAAGASDLERLRLSVPMVKLQAFLAAALARPRVEAQAPTRCTAWTHIDGEQCANPVVPGKTLCAGPHTFPAAAIEREYVERPTGKVINLGPRIKYRTPGTP